MDIRLELAQGIIPRPFNWNRKKPVWMMSIQSAGKIFIKLSAVVLMAMASGCTNTGTPQWPSMTVNSTGDESDYAPGDGKCQIAANSSVCTLRAAIQESNAYPGEPQTVFFDLPENDTVIRPNGTLNYIDDNLILDGTSQSGYDGTTPVVILDGSSAGSGFTVQKGHSLIVKALEIRNFSQMGIESFGMFTVDRSIITGNGEMGIKSHGSGYQTIKDSIIRNNGTQDPAIPTGGMLVMDGTVTVTNSLFTGNTGWNSGAIYIKQGEVRLNGCTLQDNIGWDAGAVYVAEGADNLLWIKDGTKIGTPGHGNIAGVISEGTKLGGGIYSEADVILKDSSIEGNSGAGIQIFHKSGLITLDISGSVIAGNSLQGIDARNTDVTLTDSDIRENQSGGIAMHLGTLNLDQARVTTNENSGGIMMEGGHLVMTDSTVAENTNFGPGGGVYGHNLSDANITRSTVSGNSTDGDGGGLYLHSFGQVQILNSTISSNHAAAEGGGLEAAGGVVELNNVTLTQNTAASAGGLHSAAMVHVTNTILAENSGGNCGGSITSDGHNLDTASTCGFTGPGDLSGLVANLGPLQDNGGTTFTHALLAGSPALEAGDDATCLPTDQRGIARPQGLLCDMGAFEAENPTTATPPTVKSIQTPTQTKSIGKITPTSTPTPIIFDPVNFSTDVIYSRFGRTCTPREVTIQVKVSPAELIQTVGLFYRLEEKEGTNITPWSAGFSMVPQGGGWYKLTISSEDFPDTSQWGHDAWLEIQLVANGKDGQPLARSEVYQKVTLGRCVK